MFPHDYVSLTLHLRSRSRFRYTPSLALCVFNDALKSLFEPVQTQENNRRVDRNRVSHHNKDIQDDLLIQLKKIYVDRIEPALCACAGGKE